MKITNASNHHPENGSNCQISGLYLIATNPWWNTNIFRNEMQPWILVKGLWLWVEIYIYIVPDFLMSVGSFLGYVSWKTMDAFLRWFFRILKTDKSQSKHPKKKNANSSRRCVKMKNSSEISPNKRATMSQIFVTDPVVELVPSSA